MVLVVSGGGCSDRRHIGDRGAWARGAWNGHACCGVRTDETRRGAPPPYLLRHRPPSAAQIDGDLSRLASPASLETEERAWGVLQSYCKVARGVMGGSRKSDLKEAQGVAPRRALALQLRAEKKRMLSELEKRLQLVAARSRKAKRILPL